MSTNDASRYLRRLDKGNRIADAREVEYRWIRDLKLLRLRQAYFREQ